MTDDSANHHTKPIKWKTFVTPCQIVSLEMSINTTGYHQGCYQHFTKNTDMLRAALFTSNEVRYPIKAAEE